MLIVHKLGDIPLRAAYTLIKAIGKKQQDKIDSYRGKFVEGAQKKGLTAKQAEEFFELILKFAGYGFNKSHSTGYAIIAYQTAFLKTYFPVQYMAAVLTYESVSIDKVVEYMSECRKVLFPDSHRGIEVRPPDINQSSLGFTVVFDKNEKKDANHGHIRFGLTAVKGVGEKAIQGIIDARNKDGPFTSLFNFCERVPQGVINRSVVEALIKCGAFDSLHTLDKRAALCTVIEDAMKRGAQDAALRSSGDFLFGAVLEQETKSAARKPEPALPNTTPWVTTETLIHEKSVLGFYVSNHPLEQYRDELQRFANVGVADLQRLGGGVEVIVGGMFTRVRTVVTKNGRSAGQKMAMIAIEDATGKIEGVAFAETFATYAPIMQADRVVFLKGKIDRKRESPNIIVNEVIDAPRAAAELAQGVRIVLKEEGQGPRAKGQGWEGEERVGSGIQGQETNAQSDAARHGHFSAHANGNGAGGNGNGNANGHGNGTSAHDSPYNGSLRRLKELLRQASHNGRAEVLFEIHQAGKVVTLRAQGVRVRPDADLPSRIDTVLGTPGCAQLIGPSKLLQQLGAAHMLHDDAQVNQRLMPRNGDDEFCASIDRY